ncbi:MAG: hypothetical protein IJ889_00330 [Eubacterium sp.]|nr:hypothetical protein [Eubacterium sp.]MBR2247278.1 hypothetical protein [Bacilli bacterium]
MNEPVFPFVRLTKNEHFLKMYCIAFLRWMFTKVPNKFREIIFVKEGKKRASRNTVLTSDEDIYGLDPNCRMLIINLDSLFAMKIPDDSTDIPKYKGEYDDYDEQDEIDQSKYPFLFNNDKREQLSVVFTILMATLVHEVMHSFVLTDFSQCDNDVYMWQIEYLVDAQTRDFLYQYESEIKIVFNIDICHTYIDRYLEFARRKYFPGEFVGDKYAQNTKRM